MTLTPERRNDYIAAAKDSYEEEGRIEIDEGADVSDSEKGAYVAAWLWVSKEDVPE